MNNRTATKALPVVQMNLTEIVIDGNHAAKAAFSTGFDDLS